MVALFLFQSNWLNHSHGFLWDWAECIDDDVTKNYPFPAPRVRDLPSEFITECCELHSHSAPSTNKESSKAASNIKDASSHNPASLSHFTVTPDDGDYASSDESTKGGPKNLVCYSSDSNLQPPRHVKPPHHDHTHYSFRNSKRYRGTYRFRSRKHKNSTRCTAGAPPDASQQDIAKAKHKLFHKGQSLEV